MLSVACWCLFPLFVWKKLFVLFCLLFEVEEKKLDRTVAQAGLYSFFPFFFFFFFLRQSLVVEANAGNPPASVL